MMREKLVAACVHIVQPQSPEKAHVYCSGFISFEKCVIRSQEGISVFPVHQFSVQYISSNGSEGTVIWPKKPTHGQCKAPAERRPGVEKSVQHKPMLNELSGLPSVSWGPGGFVVNIISVLVMRQKLAPTCNHIRHGPLPEKADECCSTFVSCVMHA